MRKIMSKFLCVFILLTNIICTSVSPHTQILRQIRACAYELATTNGNTRRNFDDIRKYVEEKTNYILKYKTVQEKTIRNYFENYNLYLLFANENTLLNFGINHLVQDLEEVESNIDVESNESGVLETTSHQNTDITGKDREIKISEYFLSLFHDPGQYLINTIQEICDNRYLFFKKSLSKEELLSLQKINSKFLLSLNWLLWVYDNYDGIFKDIRSDAGNDIIHKYDLVFDLNIIKNQNSDRWCYFETKKLKLRFVNKQKNKDIEQSQNDTAEDKAIDLKNNISQVTKTLQKNKEFIPFCLSNYDTDASDIFFVADLEQQTNENLEHTITQEYDPICMYTKETIGKVCEVTSYLVKDAGVLVQYAEYIKVYADVTKIKKIKNFIKQYFQKNEKVGFIQRMMSLNVETESKYQEIMNAIETTQINEQQKTDDKDKKFNMKNYINYTTENPVIFDKIVEIIENLNECSDLNDLVDEINKAKDDLLQSELHVAITKFMSNIAEVIPLYDQIYKKQEQAAKYISTLKKDKNDSETYDQAMNNTENNPEANVTQNEQTSTNFDIKNYLLDISQLRSKSIAAYLSLNDIFEIINEQNPSKLYLRWLKP